MADTAHAVQPAAVAEPPKSAGLARTCRCGRHLTPGTGECAECRAKRLGTARAGAAGDESPGRLPSIVGDVLESAGTPLDAATRAFMEARFRRGAAARRPGGSAPMPALRRATLTAPGALLAQD